MQHLCLVTRFPLSSVDKQAVCVLIIVKLIQMVYVHVPTNLLIYYIDLSE